MKFTRYLVYICVLCMALLITGCAGKNSKPHTISYEGWQNVIIPKEVAFQIPPTLEVQSENYKNKLKEVAPKAYEKMYSNPLKLYVQQKGLNDNNKEAFNQYVRVIIEVIHENDRDFPKWGEPFSLTQDELNRFEDVFLGFANQQMNQSSMKLIKKKNSSIDKINGTSCIHFSYDTQMNDNPVIYNDVYIFFDKQKIYKVQTMIRSTEYDSWTNTKDDVRKIVNTLRPVK